MSATDSHALAVVLGKIRRIADRQVAEGRTPTHVLDRNPRPAQEWVLVSTYAALALDMLAEAARRPAPTGFPSIDAHMRMLALADSLADAGHPGQADLVRAIADEVLRGAMR